MEKFLFKNEKTIGRIAIFAVFLGLIRSLSEPFRLQYYSTTPLSFEQVKPFLVGCIMASIGLLIMTLLSFYNRYRIIVLIAALTILSMIIVKFQYQI
jgi:hypothetical protein